MKARRVWAIAHKEGLHVWRDPRSLGMGIAMPMLLLLLFGYALTLDVDRVPLAVWDQSESPASRDFLRRFQASRYFAIRRWARHYRDLEQAIDAREALLGLVVPRDFAGQVASGRPATAQLLVDGSDPSTATLAAGYAEVVTQDHSQAVIVRALQRAGRRASEPPVELRPRAWFNDDLQSRNYLVPGLIAVIMMVIAAMLTSLTVAREWERGTMEQLLATPVRGGELILGKLIPYFAIGLLDVTLAVALGEGLFQVPLRGSLLLLFGTTALFLTGTLGLGLLISIVAKNQMLANQLAMILTFVPAFLLSGLMFAISNMPGAVQVVTCFIPARYFVALLRGLYLKGVGVEILATEIVLLAVFAVVMVGLANLKFQRRLA
jgi:ABC-2 type transport system permease protein